MGIFTLSKTKQITASLVLDLSPHSVAIAILTHEEKSLPHLIYTHREYVTYSRKPSAKEISQKISKLITKVVDDHVLEFLKATRKGDSGFIVSKAYIMHSLAWSFSSVRRIQVNHDTPILVTKENLDKITEESANKSSGGKGMRLISRVISDIDLNGYAVKNPWNKKTKRLSLTSSETYIDTLMIKASEAELSRRLHVKFIHTTEGYATYEMLRRTHPELSNSALIHVGGETTEMTLLKDGVLSASSSIPFGIHTLCRSVGAGKEHDQEIAYSHIVSALTKTRSFTKAEKESFDDGIKAWQKAIGESLHSIAKGAPLPSDIYLISLPHYKLITEAVANYKTFMQWSDTEHQIRTIFEEPHDKTLYTVEKGNLYDPLLTIAIISYLT